MTQVKRFATLDSDAYIAGTERGKEMIDICKCFRFAGIGFTVLMIVVVAL